MRRSSVVGMVLIGCAAAGAVLVLWPRYDGDGVAGGGPPATLPARGAVVYWFHSTRRCAECRRVESLARQAVMSGFGREVRDGTVLWCPVNWESPANGHYQQRYALSFASVVVVKVRGGRETDAVKLDELWRMTSAPAAFAAHVQKHLRAALEDGP